MSKKTCKNITLNKLREFFMIKMIGSWLHMNVATSQLNESVDTQ